MSTTPEITRLHITPFNPNLLTAIIPPSLLPSAQNISYHSLSTFPEKGYGFVDLPTMDAEKLKNKLNGSLLRGNKIRIEKARPATDFTHVAEPEASAPKPQRERDPTKKRKRGEETIPAAELRDRKVKRGWTTPAAELGKAKKESKELKNVVKSKFTTNEECLFKTVLPPNIASHTKTSGDSKARKNKKGKDTVVHEFTKSTKYATFLRSNVGGEKGKVAVEFVDGKGWVDEDGNVVEEVIKKVRKSEIPQKVENATQAAAISGDSSAIDEVNSAEEDSSSDESTKSTKKAVGSKDVPNSKDEAKEDSTSESDSSSDGDSSSDEDEDHDTLPAKKFTLQADKLKSTKVKSDLESSSGDSSSSNSESSADGLSNQDPGSSSESSSDSDSDDADSESDDGDVTQSPTSKKSSRKSAATPPLSINAPHDAKVSRPPSSSGLSIVIPESSIQATSVNTEVHPLEALYKRPKLSTDIQPAAQATSFSFFGPDDENDDLEVEQDILPQTPFTRKDFEYRNIRSAAPTPDTAYINQKFTWPGSNDNYEEEEDLAPSPGGQEASSASTSKDKDSSTASAETDFQKWFYEHRGENTRGWKKRRKAVAKEHRHRENTKKSHN